MRVCFFVLGFILTNCFYIDQKKFERDVARTAKKILNSMTIEQKVGQLFHVGIPDHTLSDKTKKIFQRVKPGGVIYFGFNLKSERQIKKLNFDLNKLAKKNSGIPLLFSTDQEGGRIQRLPSSMVTKFPGALGIGQAELIQPGLSELAGVIVGQEMLAAQIDLVFSPVLDINNNPENPVINDRSFGSDVKTVINAGVNFEAGLRKAGAISVIKHFPGHGDTNVDSHLALPFISKSEKQLLQMELLPFKVAIDNGVEAIMSAHIKFVKLDPVNPATLSHTILTELLREKMGFEGLIITDAMEMKAIRHDYSWEKSAQLAFTAGADVILLTDLGNPTYRMFNFLLRGFKTKRLDEKKLDESVMRQLKLKLNRGLFSRLKIPKLENPELLAKMQKYRKEKVSNFIANKLKRLGLKDSPKAPSVKTSEIINKMISEKAIRSLYKKFDNRFIKKCKLFLNKPIKLNSNYCKIASGGINRVRRILYKNIYPDQTIFIEINQKQVKKWNNLAKWHDKRSKDQELSPLVALFTGNPFSKVHVPENGGVLSSFSPTQESKIALFNSTARRRVIPKARLKLP